MFCENCGNQIPDDSAFCEECGTRVDLDATVIDATLKAQHNIPVPPTYPAAPPTPAAPVPAPAVPPSAAPAYRTQQQVPGYSPQPTGYYGSQQPVQQPVQQPHSPKKAPVGMIIGIIAAVVVIGVGGFFGIRALLSAKDDQASVADVSPSESVSVSDSFDSPDSPEDTPAVSDNVLSPATPEETPNASDKIVSPTTPEETPTPDPQPHNTYEDYRGYANGDDASLADFFWFTEDVKWDGLPTGTTAITDFNAIAGYWKAHTEYIPTFSGDGEYWKWFNAEISGNADQTVFTFHTKGFTYYDLETGLSGDISADDGTYLNGRFSDGQLAVGERDSTGLEIKIKDFYILDGNQYAVGEIRYVSGEKEYIVLVRP